MNATTLRDGIFALHTRRFGTVAELMVQHLLKCGKGKNLAHDLYDDAKGLKFEVKFSRVQKRAETPVSERTVLRCIEEASSLRRSVKFASWPKCRFDCNIQQIKKAEFAILYYGLFFEECIKIFKIASAAIGPQVYYSDKQHRGNVGAGQFHINHNRLQLHIDQYSFRTLTYKELLELLSCDPVTR